MALGTPVAGAAAVLSSAGTTINVAYPSGITAGQLLVLELANASTTAVTTPAGWSLGFTVTAGGSTPRLSVFYKIATGSESGSLAVTIPSSTAQARMWRQSGVDQVNPIDVAATTVGVSTTATSYTIPSLTTTMVGVGLWVFGAVNSAGAAGWNPPTTPGTFAELWDVGAVNPNTGANYLEWSGSGATGSVPYARGSSNVRGCAGMLAVRPEVTGVAGSGGFTAPSAQLTATGQLRTSGGGALAAPASAISGAGQVRASAGGALVAGGAQLAGTGIVRVAGSGSLGSPPAAISGTAAVRATGSGALTSPRPTLASSGAVRAAGTGALVAPRATLSGTDTPRTTGAGALVAPRPALSGVGQVRIAGGGALLAPRALLSGAAEVRSSGTGGLAAPAATVAGAGAVRVAAAGTLLAPAATLTGAGDVGTVSGPNVTLAATLVRRYGATLDRSRYAGQLARRYAAHLEVT